MESAVSQYVVLVGLFGVGVGLALGAVAVAMADRWRSGGELLVSQDQPTELPQTDPYVTEQQ